MKIINLDEAVVNALNLFIKNPPSIVDLKQYSFPFVVGSGNAYNTGLIMFGEYPAIFADESNYKGKLIAYDDLIKKNIIKNAVIISASGEKDSVWEIEESKKNNLNTVLFTCSPNSTAAKLADKTFTYRKVAEPYTYNTSTYMGMIMSTTKENPQNILNFIKDLKFPDDFTNYEAYSFILPEKYINLCPMIDIKKSELFGPHLSLRAFTQGYARHAKFVNPWEKELVITLGEKSDFYGFKNHQWNINIPSFLNHAGAMAITYYIIGKIQESKPSFFKDNIKNYCLDYGPKAYGKTIPFEVIVPGN
jgi:hypothetical protein